MVKYTSTVKKLPPLFEIEKMSAYNKLNYRPQMFSKRLYTDKKICPTETILVENKETYSLDGFAFPYLGCVNKKEDEYMQTFAILNYDDASELLKKRQSIEK